MFQPIINTDKTRENLNRKPTKTKTEFKKRWMNPFWEHFKLSKNSEQLVFLASEEGYLSLTNGKDNNPWLEGWKHKGYYKDNGDDKWPWIVCSEGCEQNDKQPCVGCYYYSAFYKGSKKGEKKQNPWKKSLFAVFNVIHLAWYKKVLRLDKDKKPVTFNDVPQYNIVKCPVGEEGTTDTFFGRVLKLDIPNKHFRALLDFWDTLYWTCDGCGTGIRTHKIYCTSCGNDLVDISKTTTRKQQQEILRSNQTCNCGHTGLPVEDTECGYNEEGTMKLKTRQGTNPRMTCPLGSEPPRRMNLFSCVLNIKKEGDGPESVPKIVDFFSFDINSDISWPIPEDFTPVTEILETIMKDGKVYDMQEYKPLEVEQQAQELRVDNPYATPKDLPNAGEVNQNPNKEESTIQKGFKLGLKFPFNLKE